MKIILAGWLLVSSMVFSEEVHRSPINTTEKLVECWLSGPIKPLSAVLRKGVCFESSTYQPKYVWTIVKKGLIWGLRHHTDTIVKKLPAKWQGPVGKNAKKIADFVETLEEWKEGACVIGLTSMGIPPPDSIMACQALSWLI